MLLLTLEEAFSDAAHDMSPSMLIFGSRDSVTQGCHCSGIPLKTSYEDAPFNAVYPVHRVPFGQLFEDKSLGVHKNHENPI